MWLYQYGAPVGGRNAVITVGLDKWTHPDKQEREEIVASILASVEVEDAAG